MFRKEIKELEKNLRMKVTELKRIEIEIEEIEKKIEKLSEFTTNYDKKQDFNLKIQKKDAIMINACESMAEVIMPISIYEDTNYSLEKPFKISKSIALGIYNKKNNLSLRSKDIIYSSKNKTTREWWFEPNIKKFETTFFIILADDDKNKLYVFKIPKNTFVDPVNKFYYREDRNLSSIRIDGSDTWSFRDKLKSNITFKDFYLETLEY